MDHDAFFGHLWRDYALIAPSAASIRADLVAAGEPVWNDHVAFRTFDVGPVGLEVLEGPLLALGYDRDDTHWFPEKKLRAFSYVNGAAPEAPKIFLSGLVVDAFSGAFQELIHGLVAQVDEDFVGGPEVFWSGRPWAAVTMATYERLRTESEYAAWVAALGFHANHFTVFLNALSAGLGTVGEILTWVEARGFGVNSAGGRIKGGPGVFLEQGATLADQMPITFADGTWTIPTCYYEFARRYPVPGGGLYQGFVTANADKIFESTNAQPEEST